MLKINFVKLVFGIWLFLEQCFGRAHQVVSNCGGPTGIWIRTVIVAVIRALFLYHDIGLRLTALIVGREIIVIAGLADMQVGFALETLFTNPDLTKNGNNRLAFEASDRGQLRSPSSLKVSY